MQSSLERSCSRWISGLASVIGKNTRCCCLITLSDQMELQDIQLCPQSVCFFMRLSWSYCVKILFYHFFQYFWVCKNTGIVSEPDSQLAEDFYKHAGWGHFIKMKKIICFCVISVLLSACWPMSKGRIMRMYDCYDAQNTGMESLLKPQNLEV